MYEVVHLIASMLIKTTEFFWCQYGKEVAIPDLKLLFFSSDIDETEKDKESYLYLNKRAENPWITIPIPYLDMLEFRLSDDFEQQTPEKQVSIICDIYDKRDSEIVQEISCIVSTIYNISSEKDLYGNDEDCYLLEDKEGLREFVLSCIERDSDSEDEDDDEDLYEENYEQLDPGETHRDLIEMAMALNCSCKALDEAFVKYGFYDDGTYNPVIATINPEEYINSRKRAYFINTGDPSPIFNDENFENKIKDIKVDENWKVIE